MAKFEKYWMCNYNEDCAKEDLPEHLKTLWSDTFCNCTTNRYFIDVLGAVESNPIETQPQLLSEANADELLALAINCLQAFVQDNFLGPPISPDAAAFNVSDVLQQAIIRFCTADGEEINVNATKTYFLVVAKYLLEHLLDRADDTDDGNSLIVRWWYLRYLYVHQQCLDENAQTLYASLLKHSDEALLVHDLIDDNEYKALLLLEIAQAFMGYGRVWKAEPLLDKTKAVLGVSLEVKGILGKRTKHQQIWLPQLALIVGWCEDVEFATLPNGAAPLPRLLTLDDDVRLERIIFESPADNEIMEIPSIAQALVLTYLKFTLLSQPKDNLADEELTPFLTTLLHQQHGPWATRITSLLLNIRLESTHRRTVERSLRQCEEVVNLLSKQSSADGADVLTPVRQRLTFAYASYMRPRWSVRAELGELMISLGLIKTALDLYMDLRKWPNVIACYNQLELPHKAAEIIQQELDKNETAELWCMLGDATDNPECYRRAWELSEHRSGRAQRHWGLYFYDKKDYAAAIPHLQRSLEFNSLQENVLLRIGYAALMLENWPVAAEAYRHYTNIEPNGFESWNNLAKAYIKMNDKKRAHKVLHESLKCNFNNWKVWENFLLVSVDTGNFEDAINAYRQLIELRGKHWDAQVLQILVRAIAANAPDAAGNGTHRILKKTQTMIGHMCVLYPNESLIWELSAELHFDSPLLQAQKLQKAYRCRTQTQLPWPKNPETCLLVLQMCEQLCNASLAAWQTQQTDSDRIAAKSQLASTRLSARGTIKAASDEKWDNCTDLIGTLQDLLDKITELLMNK